MPYPTRSFVVIDFYTPIICHVIQLEFRNNMVSDDIHACSKVEFFKFKVCKTKPDSALCMGKVSDYYDVLSIGIVDFIDKQRNDNKMMIFSIKLFGKDDNDVKILKELTIIVPHDWNYNFFTLYLCEVVMKKGNASFIYLNPENDDSVEDIYGIDMLYKESTSKLIFDSYSFLTHSFSNGGKN